MIISIVYLILSFIFDYFMSSIFSNTLTSGSYFTTIYVVISFVIIFRYFHNDKKFFWLLIIFGILFDVLYTGSFMFNTVIFLIIGLIIKNINNIFPCNIFTTNIISLCSIIVYHVISFIILELMSGIDYNIMLLFNIVIRSIIMTIIYTSISYLVMGYVFNKFNVKFIK